MKIKALFLLVSSLLAISLVKFELERRDVVNEDLSMLIPVHFEQISKENYVPAYEGDPIPEDYYSNEDRSIEISFLKIPKQKDDLTWCKDFVSSAFRGSEATFFSNDIVSVGSSNIHLTEFDGTFQGKKRFCTMFFLNLKEYSIIGNISCEIEFKAQWKITAKEIFNSIEVN